MWFARIRVAGTRLVVVAGAALVWLLILILAWWTGQNPDAAAAFEGLGWVLLLVVLPVTVGAALAWLRHPAAHLVGMSSLAGMLAEWSLFVVGMVAAFVIDFERQIAFLSSSMNRLELLAGFAVVSLAGAAMGAAGGAAVMLLRRRLARGARSLA